MKLPSAACLLLLLPRCLLASGHWSDQPPVRPPVPLLGDQRGAWVRNPIDAFIAARHEQLGLQPRPPAEKHVLLRRVYLDLIGLPPSREELHAFLADGSPDAYERVVDRLLASPQYGERWGRHWMDVWRYSDWYGRRGQNEIRYSQRHIWRWRDWIIESLNEDKGYDRMVVEMLAGDEIAPADPDVLRATGFLGRNWYKFDRDVWLFETVDQTSMGLLALTMKCARCHDHKYDPISQEDYYRFRAFFEPHDFRIDPLAAGTGTEVDNGQATVLKDGLSRAFDAQPDAATYVFIRGDDRRPDKEHPLTPAVPAALSHTPVEIEPVSLPMDAWFPALRPEIVEGALARAESAVVSARQRVEDADNALPALECRSAALGSVAAKPQAADAKFSLELARQQLRTAEAQRDSLQARIVAERAKAKGHADFKSLALAAGQAERQAALADAEADLLRAERDLAVLRRSPGPNAAATDKQAIEAEKKLVAARKAVEAARAALEKPGEKYTPLGEIYPRTSTGRRLALARWIASPRNPRTARVAVNHIWLRHFGRAIVPTVADFGQNGKPPSHPELLDWLACEFMRPDGGNPQSEIRNPQFTAWSMKRLHRLIVTSSTYRMASSAAAADETNLALDPANDHYWRMTSRRMEAEVVRDSLLALSGRLDPKMGGPELDEKLGQTSGRRSLYFRVSPDNKMELLELFDLANPNECYRRRDSVVPQQALALTNSALALNQARLLARELSKEAGTGSEDDRAFVTVAFETILSRPPTAKERAACQAFLQRHAALLSDSKSLTAFPADGEKRIPPAEDPRLRARENLVHVLFNHNEFVTIR